MGKLITWCKKNWQVFVVAFFLAFIPLYPKLPLLDIFATWVYIRLEDMLVAVAVGVWLLTKIKARAPPTGSLAMPIFLYWSVGILVLGFSVLFLGPTIRDFFPHLALLHYLRRIEYMILFFVAYDITKRHKDALPLLIWTLGLTIFAVFVYGVGQKFLGFPAYLTMNEEFAKGLPLRLPPTARIASTFGGHYDLGAYLVFMLPILGSLVFGVRTLWQKIVFVFLAVCALILLLFTASRISFGVYLVAMSAMLLWHKKPLLIIPVIALSMLLLNSVSGASERFYKTFRYEDVIIDLSTGQPIGTVDQLEGNKIVVEQQERPDVESLPKGTAFVNVPGSGQEGSQSYQTIEVYKSTDLATGSGDIATISGSFLVQKALVYDISITTRFQGQWPKAIEAFKRNILLGSGFSTLSVAADGDYLRMLGESGILGTIAFLGIFVMAYVMFVRYAKKLAPLEKSFVIGVFGGIVGLLLNAVLIDVFEASKVAFTLWIIMGITMALLDRVGSAAPPYFAVLKRLFANPVAWGMYLSLLVFILYGRAVGMYFVGDDFTWLRWAAETTTGDLAGYFTQAQGFFYRPIPKLWFFLLYSVFWLKPAAYHIASLVLFSGIVLSVYDILLRLRVRFGIAFGTAALFAVLSVHHENLYWISAHSSLLAALFFFVAVSVALRLWHKAARFNAVGWVLVYVLLFLSMLSYDGMMVAPLMLWIVGMFIARRPGMALHGTLLLMPVVFGMRMSAGAVTPSGDYGYNPSAFPINAVSNGIGYLAASLGGPRIVEWFASLRAQLRSMQMPLAIAAGVAGVILAGLLAKMRTQVRSLGQIFVWMVLLGLSLSAYLGLGAMSERYALVASAILLIGLGVMAEAWLKSSSWKKTVVLLLIGGSLFVCNWKESVRMGEDWQKASDISRDTLSAIKTTYFPLTAPMSFRFYNMPIRYGRAWVFPVGLTDALWHMFKFNGYEYNTIPVETRAQVFDYPNYPQWSMAPLGFEDYKLKHLSREIETVGADEN